MTPDSSPPAADEDPGDAATSVEVGISLDSVEAAIPADPGPIVLEDVRKEYGDVTALHGASFRAATGEFHCLVGPNGSGKTTLAMVTLGLTKPSAGRIAGPTDDVGFSFQRPRYYPDLSVAENLGVFAEIHGRSLADPFVEDLSSTLRLNRVSHAVAAELSGGFEKKLDVAIALLGRPTYLWLDEPLSDVDDVSTERLLSVLAGYTDRGGGVIVSTHNLRAFAPYCTKLTAFLDGHISDTVDVEDCENPADLESLQEDLLEGLRARR
ncbi:MAG: ATP-binding cassette domain-containing protein [Halanaeroarchaeum sp.]